MKASDWDKLENTKLFKNIKEIRSKLIETQESVINEIAKRQLEKLKAVQKLMEMKAKRNA